VTSGDDARVMSVDCVTGDNTREISVDCGNDTGTVLADYDAQTV